MMKNYDTDDTFLGRWIAGELTEDERIAFEKTDAFKVYNIINNEAQLLEAPNIDTEAALKIVKHRLKTAPRKTKIIQLWKTIAVASIIIISLGYFFNSSKTYTTAIGETQTITLADGSTVNLNANSSLSHKRFLWNNNKQVALTGEAYFTITKGTGFKVATSNGIVEVLGTQFNIKDRNDFTLKCYKGKVKFTSFDNKNNDYTLTKGIQISIQSSKAIQSIFEQETPDWKQGNSVFIDQPLEMY